jgi:Cdc6-like AAA superfamily ATPase
MISHVSDINQSSNSISMLPAEPKIFHGRNSELSDILHLFSQGTPRIAILGAGGMGKTSLARAVIQRLLKDIISSGSLLLVILQQPKWNLLLS